MLGTIVNTLAVLAGSILGLLLTAVTKKFGMKVSERFSERIMQALGLCTIYIGISGSLEGENTLVLILSMVIGTLIGEALDLDEKINRLGNFLEKKLLGKPCLLQERTEKSTDTIDILIFPKIVKR